jgi:hypothetical protein
VNRALRFTLLGLAVVVPCLTTGCGAGGVTESDVASAAYANTCENSGYVIKNQKRQRRRDLQLTVPAVIVSPVSERVTTERTVNVRPATGRVGVPAAFVAESVGDGGGGKTRSWVHVASSGAESNRGPTPVNWSAARVWQEGGGPPQAR